MIEEKVHSTEIIPIYILHKRPIRTSVLIGEGNTKTKEHPKYRTLDSAILVNFKKGDYLIMSREVGENFVHISYTEMNEEDIKKYFPKREEPKDGFSKLVGSQLFSDK